MGADLYLDFNDDRENFTSIVAPQSWLRNHWGPAAKANDWPWVLRLCDNTLQITTLTDAEQLLVELAALRSHVAADDGIEPATLQKMLGRFELFVPPIEAAVASWEGVDLLSIG